MSRTFKIAYDDGTNSKEVFVIKPVLENLQSVADEVYARKPESRQQALTFYYEDSDGDKIAISNPMDFQLFLEQNLNKLFVEAKVDTVWKSLNPSFLSSAVPSAPPPSESHSTGGDGGIRSIRHMGILCDICDKDIYGFRYKCLDCEEFDMCMDCEPKQIHLEHLVLRITNPIEGDKIFKLNVYDPEDED